MKKATVLVVDTDRVNMRFLQKSLADSGFSVLTADNGTRCRQLLRAGRISALMVDVLLSRATRLDLILYVKQCFSDVPIIAMSSADSYSIEQESLAKGADLFVVKPVNVERIKDYIKNEGRQTGFSGVLEGLDILELFQFLILTECSAVLEIVSSGGTASFIHLDAGEVRHAVCGENTGEGALYRCLGFKSGIFRILPWRAPDVISVAKGKDFLLMEAVRRRDDARTGFQAPAPSGDFCLPAPSRPERMRSRMRVVLDRFMDSRARVSRTETLRSRPAPVADADATDR
ncbi:MAG: response regulator [Pseudomonadota bacterium]